MQATVQPSHDELLYQCYVTEELEKAKEYAERTTPEKSSIRERLEDAKRECAEHKPTEGKKPGRDVPEQDCL